MHIMSVSREAMLYVAPSDSRYGRITRSTRSIRAYLSRSLTLQRRRARHSLSASTATSIPILLRNLKQSATVFATLLVKTSERLRR